MNLNFCLQGIVYVASDLNREETATYLLTFEARDNNLASKSEQRKTPNYMNIILIDVNDNSPQFDAHNYSGEVKENLGIGTPVDTVLAVDNDLDDNGLVKYLSNITAGNATGLFDVRYDTGEVYVSGSLRGRHGDYVLYVIATDLGVPPQQNSVPVYIGVQDVNDAAPIIYQPRLNETVYSREVYDFI